MNHRRGNYNSNRKRKPRQRPKSTPESSDVMDDVMAQLRRQREKQKSEEKASNAQKSSSTIEGEAVGPALNNQARKSIGKFLYDPLLKRYLPKSAYKSSNNDVCIQRIQKTSRDRKNATAASHRKHHHDNISSIKASVVTDVEIRRVAFRGSCLKRNVDSSVSATYKKSFLRQKKVKFDSVTEPYNYDDTMRPPLNIHSCSEKTIILLATSLSYCSSTRRKYVASVLGSLCTARGLQVVPTTITKKMVVGENNMIGCAIPDEKECDEMSVSSPNQRGSSKYERNIQINAAAPSSIWYSMLTPICRDLANPKLKFNYNQPPTPDDSICKHAYLHPTASSFDVLPCGSSLPHVATIMGDRIIHYRTPVKILARGSEPSSITMGTQYEGGANITVPSNNIRMLQSNAPVYGIRMRLLPHQRGYNENGNKVLNIGHVSYNPDLDTSQFTLHAFEDGGIDGANRYQYELVDGGIHDFCFGRGNSHMVAFAHTSDGAAVSFLNLEAHSITKHQTRSTNWSDSDPLCVQYRINTTNEQLLIGHRDGDISLIDIRSPDVQMTNMTPLECQKSGSTVSIQQLTNNEHLFIAKRSFGLCQVFDIRRFSDILPVLRFDLPPNVHLTKSVACTGLALDRSESVVVSPYASQQNEIMMAVWSIENGKLLRTIKLLESGGGKLFCELNPHITSGFKMICTNESTPVITRARWGLWYKMSNFDCLPPGAGGIHHICF